MSLPLVVAMSGIFGVPLDVIVTPSVLVPLKMSKEEMDLCMYFVVSAHDSCEPTSHRHVSGMRYPVGASTGQHYGVDGRTSPLSSPTLR